MISKALLKVISSHQILALNLLMLQVISILLNQTNSSGVKGSLMESSPK